MSNTLTSTDLNSRLAIDAQALGDLHLKAHQTPDKALPQVAKQFESVFLNMMMKSMRATIPSGGLLDNQQTKVFTELLDKQMSQNIAQTHGLGLADMIVKQLSPAHHNSVGLKPFSNTNPMHTSTVLKPLHPTSHEPLVLKPFSKVNPAPADNLILKEIGGKL
ncbi:MAG: hypothetical protein G3H99_03405 [Ferrovum sp.]|nr:hypothetical protein [Ferrovum sp.]NDU88088.1 hypothetical protein [Ferrovum sp.]